MASATFDTAKIEQDRLEINDKTDVIAKLEQFRLEIGSKLDMNHAKLSRDLLIIRWMLGLLISFAVAVTIRVFFFPKPN